MGAFIYYLSGESGLSGKILTKHGLEYLGPSINKETQTTQKGPDGGPGIMFCFASLGVLLDGISWEKKNDTTWVGSNSKYLPSPVDLEKRMSMSHPVMLADGNIWMVPVARHIQGETPFSAWKKKDGEWISGGVIQEYQELFDAACLIWDTLVSGATEVTLIDVLDTATLALSKNYRVSDIEMSMLGCLTTQSAVEVCKALCDWPALEELKKKAAAGELSLIAGDEE